MNHRRPRTFRVRGFYVWACANWHRAHVSGLPESHTLSPTRRMYVPVPADLIAILLLAVDEADHDCTDAQVVAAMRHGVLRFGGAYAPWFACDDA